MALLCGQRAFLLEKQMFFAVKYRGFPVKSLSFVHLAEKLHIYQKKH